MADGLAKWLAWYAPLLRARFDFRPDGAARGFDALGRGLALSRGRFWIRAAGGHDLRRAVGRLPTPADPLAGRADGRTAVITTFPWVGHAPSSRYEYALFAVGAGGVVATDTPATVRAAFTATGQLEGPSPHAPRNLSVESRAGGSFRLAWTYDERGQEAPPAEFAVYADLGTPGAVNYGDEVAAVPYLTAAAMFEFISAPFEHGRRVTWAVRARTAAGVLERNELTAFAVARALPPAAGPAPAFGPQPRP